MLYGYVDLHARLIQCFAHLYRIADPGQDQNNPVTLALAVVPMGQFSMPIPGQFSVQINTLEPPFQEKVRPGQR